PRDEGGKRLIRDIVDFVRKNNVQHRIVFIEDYDLHVARRLVQGCDVWLNTPIRGLEASGTSGMKAAVNGCLHCSILDGWWDEGYDPEAGFAIGRGENYDEHNRDEMDDIESRSLYHLIQSQIVPEFYEREGATEGGAGVPRRWLARMRRCIKSMAPAFNTHRMLRDYATGYYFPAHVKGAKLTRDGLTESRGLARQIEHYRHNWHKIEVESVESQSTTAAVSVRSLVRVTATVRLADISPAQVQVQLYHGRLGALGELLDGSAPTMQHARDLGDGRHEFTGAFAPAHSGQHGFSVRVIPNDPRLVNPFVPGLITWHNDAKEGVAEEARV
ncbi:MAG TPA: alpha-glucan family phosphorylase, partial [Phycisphaerales bacterium]|nr:alpha-glucan family phosphorylase [Phycisphaerales bacterium]